MAASSDDNPEGTHFERSTELRFLLQYWLRWTGTRSIIFCSHWGEADGSAFVGAKWMWMEF